MSVLLLQNFLLVASIVITLIFLAYLYSAFERRLVALSEQRQGPSRAGALGEWQTLADFFAGFSRRGFLGLNIFALTKILLPALFVVFLFFVGLKGSKHEAELAILLALVLFASLLLGYQSIRAPSEHEKNQFRGELFNSLIGNTLLLFTCANVVLAVGSLSLAEITKTQQVFPYHLLFRSPALFLSGVLGLLAPFYIFSLHPVGQLDVWSRAGIHQQVDFWAKRFWVVAYASLWVFLFSGGLSSWLVFPLFIFRVMVILAILLFLQVAISRIRLSDAQAIAIKSVLPLSVLAIFVQMIWMGLWR